ncbi:MAG: polyphenol oxidase family protein [Deltaproteobacteria bacterium]|nr:polyphenol oxidase family protein [Deltaproteobacteria bacterium]
MIKNVKDQVVYYTFNILAKYPELRHGVMTRRGPQGQDWTFSYQYQDEPKIVNTNIETACNILGLKPAAFVLQNHGTNTLILAPHEIYRPQRPEDVFQGFDAIISGFGHSMMIKLADCQGLIVYDPISRTLALVHSGWRGSVQNIIGKTIKTMTRVFKLDPKNFLACCSPSLGPCCAEFINYRTELPEYFWEFKNDNDYFDFTAISRRQLLKAGLIEDNIEFSGLCTRCSDEFYSYRRGENGRFAVIAGVSDN